MQQKKKNRHKNQSILVDFSCYFNRHSMRFVVWLQSIWFAHSIAWKIKMIEYLAQWILIGLPNNFTKWLLWISRWAVLQFFFLERHNILTMFMEFYTKKSSSHFVILSCFISNVIEKFQSEKFAILQNSHLNFWHTINMKFISLSYILKLTSLSLSLLLLCGL